MAIEIVEAPSAVRLRTLRPVSDDELLELSMRNPELRLERTAGGELIIMPPSGAESGRRCLGAASQLAAWAGRDGSGLAFDSSAGFRLPDGSVRAADAAWVRKDRWEALTREEREKYAPLCPDFVLELRSPSDRLADLEGKLAEWIANGARLGWLIEPFERQVQVYQPGASVARLDAPERLSADPVLPGFVLDLASVW